MKMKVLFALVVCAAVFCFTAGNAFAAAPPYVHDFSCDNCHTSGSDLTSTAGNICITCHGQGSPGGSNLAHLRNVGGPIMVPSKNFAVDMSSDALGTRTAEIGSMASGPGSETSHNWNASDVNPAAGAMSPVGTKFYGRQNYAGSNVSCARCHDPHGYAVDYGTTVKANPKLLKLGVNSKDKMCVDCHRNWDTTPANALLTHPLVNDYPTFLLTADPAKFKAFTPPTADMALGVDPTSLTVDSILCSTCHGTHFTDSDSSSADTPATVLVGDGKLLKATGAAGATAAERSELCNSCHVYAIHGATANQIGCLDCHSGHSYNDGTANYFVLRSDVDTAAYGVKTGLRYTSVPTNATERAAIWAGGAGVDGYCEGCHGDVTNTAVGGISEKRVHTISDDCNNCHQHGQVSFQAQGCDQCHGYPPVENVAGGAPNAGFAVAEGGIYDYSGQTPFYDEASTKHSIHAAGGVGEYKFACAACHENNQHNPTDVLTQTFQDVFNAPANTLASAGGALIPAYNGTGGCDAVYCHSNGRTRGATPAKKNPNLWLGGLPTGGITVCDDCHGNTSFTMTLATNSGAHAKHLDKGYTCNLCHTNTALNNDALQADARNGDTAGPNSGKHVNGSVDVEFVSSPLTQLNSNLGVPGTDGTCQNIYCHSAGPSDIVGVIPDWDTTVTDCASCHNDGGGNAQPATGSHAVHMTDVNGPQITLCSTCHEHDGALSANTHVDGFIATIDIAAKCNACHGATAAATAGNDREPIWGNGGSVDCETCHSGTAVATINAPATGNVSVPAPPVDEAAYNNGHGKPNVANPVDGEACILCHTAATVAGHLGGATVTRLATAYAGAAADEAFCNNCHATENNHSTAAGTSCQTCHAPHGEANGNDAMIKSTVAGNTVTAFTTQGVRTSYANAANTGICQTCHTPWNGSTGIKYFNKTSNDQTHNVGNACSQCHKHDSTPTFKGAAVDCAGCHADEMASSGHAAHVQKNSLSTLIEDDLSDCVLCHGAAVTDGIDPYTLIGGGNGKHQNGTADFAAAILYNNNATPANKADDTCAGACHSSTATDGAWGDTALNCTACHNNSGTNDGVLANAAPGADHQLHLGDGYTCDNCHDAGTAIPAAGTTTHITDLVLTEIDAAILTDMGTVSAGEATVDDSSFNTGIVSYVAGTKTCNNSACHNPSGDSHAAVWESSTVSCNLCHGDDAVSPSTTGMITGSHGKHLDNAAIIGDNAVCADCHGATSGMAHLSGSVDFAAAAGWGVMAAQTCGSATSCHFDGWDPIQSPAWGAVVPSAGVCDLCHQAPDNSGDHLGHWISNRTTNGLQCASCHFDTVNANLDPLNTLTTVKTGGSHINGNRQDVVAGFDYRLTPVTITPFTAGTPSTCTTNCHSVNPKPWEVQTGCGSCHGNLSYVDATSGGSVHTKHIDITTSIETDVTECVVCHGADIANYTITGGDAGSGNHQDASVQLAAGISTAAAGCTSACHASSATDGSWVDVDSLNCTACHNNGTNDNVLVNAAPADASHSKHVMTNSMTCVDCHGTLPATTAHISGLNAAGAAGADQGETLTNKAAPVSNNASVDDSPFNDAGISFNDTVNSCSNTYCHDPSNNTTGAIWNTDTATCALCHGDDQAGTKMATGTHTNHLDAAATFGQVITCDKCHPTNASNGHFIATTGPTTVNQAVLFSGSVITGAQISPVVNGMYSGEVALPDSGFGSCGTTACHNNGQGGAPNNNTYTWGTTNIQNCLLCHNNMPTTGAHATHLDANIKYGPFTSTGGSTNCGLCHAANTGNTSMAGQATHINGTISFAGAQELTTGAIAADATVTVCDTCHGGTTAVNLVTIGAKAVWAAGGPVACETCHGDYSQANVNGVLAPVRAGTAYTLSGHGKPGVAKACVDCHNHAGDHIGYVTNRLNTIAFKDYNVDPNGFCNACHTTLPNSAVHNANGASGTSDDALTCVTCHDQHGQNGGQDAMIASTVQTRAVSGFGNRALRSSYANIGNTGICQVCHDPNDPTAAGGTINYFNRTSGDAALSTHNVGQICTTCHSHTDTPIFKPSGCNGCHGGGTVGANASNYWPDGNDGVAGPDDAGRHLTHMNILAQRVYGVSAAAVLNRTTADTDQKALCEYCHAANINDSDHGATANLPAEVFVDKDNFRHAKSLWGTADSSAAYAAGSCSNIDCHNSKVTGTGTFGWYDAGASTCTMCHTPGIAGSNPTTGLHTVVNNPTEVQVHDNTLGTGCTECHNSLPVIGNTAGSTHINGTFAADSAVNNDRGISVSGNITAFSQAAVGISDSCASNCHSDVGSWQRLWSKDADSVSNTVGDPRCNVCHGYLNNWRTGMTPDHSTRAAINNGTHSNCATCHVRPNAPYAVATYHDTNSTLGTPTELGAPGHAVELNVSVGYDMANGNCTNICHTNDVPHTLGTSAHFPANGLAGPAADCNTCHLATGGSNNLNTVGTYTFNSRTGAHGKHVLSAASSYGDTVDHSTATNYDFGCALCHPANSINHQNGVLDLILAPTDAPASIKGQNGATAAYAAGTCSAVYCHGDGVTPGSSPDFLTGTFTNPNGDYCQNCHGNQPLTGSHPKHVIGIHSDDVYTGTSGKLAEAGGSGAGHGDVTTALTITCAVCHNSTVNQWFNGNNTACVSCHGTAGVAIDKTVIVQTDLDKSFHVNGTKDVTFAPVNPLRSKAQVRDFTPGEPELNTNWTRTNGYKAGTTSHDQGVALNTATMWTGATKNCMVTCHNGNTATWGAAGASCDLCHTQLPK